MGFAACQRHQGKTPAAIKPSVTQAITRPVSHLERTTTGGSATVASHLNSVLYAPGGKLILTGRHEPFSAE